MDQVAPQFRAIAARRQAIQADLADLQAKIEALETERGELEVAARVLHRLGLLAEEAGPELPLPSISPGDGEPRPTVPEMIRAVILGLVDAGLPGATSQQVLTEINRRWGISDPNIVRPTLWRMVKSNRLERNGDVYMLTNNASDKKPVGIYQSLTQPLSQNETKISNRGSGYGFLTDAHKSHAA